MSDNSEADQALYEAVRFAMSSMPHIPTVVAEAKKRLAMAGFQLVRPIPMGIDVDRSMFTATGAADVDAGV